MKLVFRRAFSSQRNSLFQKLDNVILSRSVNAEKGLQLFYVCKEQCESKRWFELAKIPDNFHGRHGLLMLHVWMINKRLLLLPDNRARQEIQETLFDTLWNDTMARIRAAGVTEISVNARLKDVQEWSLPTCMELDYAFSIPTINNSNESTSKSKSYMQMKSNISPTDDQVIKEHPDISKLTKKQVQDLVIDHIGGTLWRQIYQRNEFNSGSSSNSNSSDIKPKESNAGDTSSANNTAAPAAVDAIEQIITTMAAYVYHEYDSLAYDITDYVFENVLFRFGMVPSSFADKLDHNNVALTRFKPNEWDECIVVWDVEVSPMDCLDPKISK